MSAHRFKVGQKVVAILSHRGGFFNKGDVLTVHSLTCCENCGLPGVTVAEITEITNVSCTGWVLKGCGHVTNNVRMMFMEKCFAPLSSTSEACEYKMKVSIPELLTIKEYQEQ